METLLQILIDPDIDTSEGVRLFLGDVQHGWWYAAVILIAGALCVWSYLRIRARIRPRYRWLMIATRLIMLLAVFFLLLRPTLLYSSKKVPQVAVLLPAAALPPARDGVPPGGRDSLWQSYRSRLPANRAPCFAGARSPSGRTASGRAAKPPLAGGG